MLNLLAEDDFIDGGSVQEESEEPSFYRFVMQTRDLNEALNCDDGSHLDRRHFQSEMFIAEGRENVDFNEFDESTKLSDKFKKTLCKYEYIDAKDSFFGAALFGHMTKSSSTNENFTVESAVEKIGEKFTEKLFSEKENLHLDDSFESFFDKCHLVNELLEEKHLFFEGV